MRHEIADKLIEQNKTIYEQIARDFSVSRANIWPEFEYFKGYLQKNQDILDLGCGNGRLLVMLKDYQPNYLGIDFSAKLVEEAQKKWPDYSFKVADILDLSFLENKFDLVFLIATLHHIPSDRLRLKVLREVYSVLRPGGKLLMINWNLWQKDYLKYIIKYTLLKLAEPTKQVLPGIKAKDLDLQDVFVPWQKKHLRYIHALTELNVASLVKKTGFEIIKNVSNKRNIITVAKKLKFMSEQEKQPYTKPEITKIEKSEYDEKIEKSAAQDKQMDVLSQVGMPQEIEEKFKTDKIEEQTGKLKDNESINYKKQEELAAMSKFERIKIDKIIKDNIDKPDFKKRLSAINPEKIDAKAIEKGLAALMGADIDLPETERLNLFNQSLEYYADTKNFEHPLVWHSSGSFTLRNGMREGFKGGYGRVAGETSHFIDKHEDKKYAEVQKGLSVTHPDDPSAEYFQQLFARLGAKKEELPEFLALDSEKLTDKKVIETFIQAYKNTHPKELKKYVADSLGQPEDSITDEAIDALMKQKIEAITQRQQEAKSETIKKEILPEIGSEELRQTLLEEAEHPFPVFMSFDLKGKQENLTTVSRGEKPVPHLPFEDRYYDTVNKEQIAQLKVPISQIDKVKQWCLDEGIEPEIIPIEIFEVKRLIENQIEK